MYSNSLEPHNFPLRLYNYLLFTYEETRAQKGLVTCPGSEGCEVGSQDPSPGSLTPDIGPWTFNISSVPLCDPLRQSMNPLQQASLVCFKTPSL